MAKVYTGKVAIPGDQIEAYFKALEETERQREPFRKSLESLNREFAQYLSRGLGYRTVRKHAGTIEMFIEFLCRQTDVERIEDITKGIANTHFHTWYKRKVWDSTPPSELRTSVSRFFEFLASEKGIVNEKVLGSIKQQPRAISCGKAERSGASREASSMDS